MSNAWNQSGRWPASWARALWHGRGRSRAAIRPLIWFFLGFLLARYVWGVALRLAPFPSTTKTLSLILALLAVVLALATVVALIRSALILGAKRFLPLLLILFVLLVLARSFTVPDQRPFGERLLSQSGESVLLLGDLATSLVDSLVDAPDDYLFAYTGERQAPSLPPGFPTPDPQATPIRSIAVPATGE